MFNALKLSISTFKKKWKEYLAVSFVFGVITFISIFVGKTFVGILIPYVVIMIPSIISLKFCAFQSYDKDGVEFKSLKIGFLTFFKSIKVYLIVVLKPILIALAVGIGIYSLFLYSAITVASEVMPDIMESLSNKYTVEYVLEDMMKVENVDVLVIGGAIISLLAGYLTYFSIKLKRDFIPFIAFEMPVTSKRAIDMNKKILGKKYLKFYLSNLAITLLFIIPISLTFLNAKLFALNEVFSPSTIFLMSSIVFCMFYAPIVMFKQLNYIYCYKELSKPFKDDFDNELRNVLKELEELQKK